MSKRQARRNRGRQAGQHPRPARKLPRPASMPISDESIAAPHATRALGRRRLFAHHSLRDIFGTTFWVFVVLAIATGIACYLLKGPDVVRASLAGDIDLLLFVAPRFAVAMLIAAFVQVLLPRDLVARYVGEGAGIKALGIATVVGGLTPGGPMTSFPLVRTLRDAGTGRSALVAYITSWSTIGFQRILNWELPLLGGDFTLLRLAASLPLPAIAGMISQLLPREVAAAEEAPPDAR